MAGWSVTDWSTNPDWASASLLNEFVDAVNERKIAVGQGGPLSTVQVGDDVQAAGGVLGQVQDAIEGMLGSFVVSHDNGTKRQLNFWRNEGGPEPHTDTYTSVGHLLQAMGVTGSMGWRRYRDAPESEGGTLETGPFQVGDIIGPWLFDDLQTALNGLIWTGAVPGIENLTNFGEGARQEGWLAAIAQADADWDSGDNEHSDTNEKSEADTTGVWDSGVWRAVCRRVISRASVPTTTTMARHVAWYAYSERAYTDGDWDANGDTLLEDKWEVWLDEPFGIGEATQSSQWLGATMTQPIWCDAPVEDGPRSDLGYAAWNAVAIISWDVAGGFTYR